MYLGVYSRIWFKLGMMMLLIGIIYCTLHFYTSLFDLDLDSKSQEFQTWYQFDSSLNDLGVHSRSQSY